MDALIPLFAILFGMSLLFGPFQVIIWSFQGVVWVISVAVGLCRGEGYQDPYADPLNGYSAITQFISRALGIYIVVFLISSLMTL